MNVVMPTDPAMDVALSGPRWKMASTSPAVALASRESTVSATDIRDYVIQEMTGTLVLGCTGSPMNLDAIEQAATAHSHKVLVNAVARRRLAHDRVAAAVATAIVIVEDKVDRPRLCSYIESEAASRFRPAIDPGGAVQITKSKRVATRKGPSIEALWDLRWAAIDAANNIVRDLPEGSSLQAAAGVFADSISRELPCAVGRLFSALRHADT